MNTRQTLFVENLFKFKFNQTKAAIAAGYSKKTARITASKLLTNPNIQKALNDKRKELLNNIKEDQLKTVEEIDRLAHFELKKLFNQKTGELKPLHKIDKNTAKAIAGFKIIKKTTTYPGGTEVTEDRTEITLSDRQKAIDMKGKFQGLFVERHKHGFEEGQFKGGMKIIVEEIDISKEEKQNES